VSIPERQLDTWSRQGSSVQSKQTYNSVKSNLETRDAPYASRLYHVFLQGSYGNDTNIHAESDVDVVIRLDACFYHNVDTLPGDQQAAFHSQHSNAIYAIPKFKDEVISVLSAAYADDVAVGSKAITIKARGGRRKSDVIVAAEYRRYKFFRSSTDQAYTKGICFITTAGASIENYPQQHSDNLTTKHQETKDWLKPMVRVFKNARSKLVEDGLIEPGSAPSFYVEGLLYNIPTENFGGSYQGTFSKCVEWLLAAEKAKLVGASQMYYLIGTTPHVQWKAEQCEAFLNGVVKLWNDWQ
jgi:hypothetical protein